MAYIDFKSVLSTPFFELEASDDDSDQAADPYYRITGPNSAIMCVFDHQANVLLVNQFRPSLGIHTLEFPAGAIDAGEDPVQAARREILEESGYATSLFGVGSHFYLMMDRTNIKDYLFAGLIDPSRTVAVREAGIQVEWISRKNLLKAALEGRYLQLAGLGILQLLGGVLGIDMLQASDAVVVRALRNHLTRLAAKATG